jgi:hypothetical protein
MFKNWRNGVDELHPIIGPASRWTLGHGGFPIRAAFYRPQCASYGVGYEDGLCDFLWPSLLEFFLNGLEVGISFEGLLVSLASNY